MTNPVSWNLHSVGYTYARHYTQAEQESGGFGGADGSSFASVGDGHKATQAKIQSIEDILGSMKTRLEEVEENLYATTRAKRAQVLHEP